MEKTIKFSFYDLFPSHLISQTTGLFILISLFYKWFRIDLLLYFSCIIFIILLARLSIRIKRLEFLLANLLLSYILNAADLITTFFILKSENIIESNIFFLNILSGENAILNYCTLFMFKALISTIITICLQEGFSIKYIDENRWRFSELLFFLKNDSDISVIGNIYTFIKFVLGREEMMIIINKDFYIKLRVYYFIFYKPMIFVILISIFVPINNLLLYFYGSRYQLSFLYFIYIGLISLWIISSLLLYSITRWKKVR